MDCHRPNRPRLIQTKADTGPHRAQDTKRINSVLKPQLLANIRRGDGHVKGWGANSGPLITGLVIASYGLKDLDVMGTMGKEREE